ncbi:hypothetical protein EDB19DRAFT_1921620 [Suillus lakei]|nr:hypothetical protein EDB19DRAFT_1921620 [Suillus lakei]
MPPSLDLDQEASVWPKWVPVPFKRLTNASNSVTPKLSTHLEAIALKQAEDAKHLVEDARPYTCFKVPLQAAINKITMYYEKTSNSDAYIMVMLLDPNEKMNHFKKYWDENLQQEALENVEHVFQEYYVRIHGDAEHIPVKKGHTSRIKVARLLWELSDDDNNDDNMPTSYALSAATSSINPQKPWLQDFNYYVNTFDQLAENQSIVQWWGIFKCNEASWPCQSQGDVVEALQVMKCLLCHDLVFCESGPSSLTKDPADENDELLDGCPEKSGEDSMIVIDIESLE